MGLESSRWGCEAFGLLKRKSGLWRRLGGRLSAVAGGRLQLGGQLLEAVDVHAHQRGLAQLLVVLLAPLHTATQYALLSSIAAA